MIIIIGRILSSIGNKPMKFKIKSIALSFIRTFSFLLNHLRITAIYKYTKPNSRIICAGINKKPMEQWTCPLESLFSYVWSTNVTSKAPNIANSTPMIFLVSKDSLRNNLANITMSTVES